ncbi:discoidin domain-containing protein [Myxococcota bacterium]
MRLVVAPTLFALVLACGELPEPSVPGENVGKHTTSQDPNDPTDPNDPNDPNDPTDPNAPPPDAPTVGSLPTAYGYVTLPMRGHAEPFQTVFVEGGRAPVATDADTAGSFCLDVPLAEGVTQTLEVFVQDDRGETSDATEVTLHQDPSLAEYIIPEQPLVDVAGGLPVFSNETPKEGLFSNLTDQDPTTTVLVCKAYVWVDLGERYDLETIEIEFPDVLGEEGNDEFATEYQVLASDLAAPLIPPDIDDETWTLIFDVFPGSGMEAGDGGVDTLPLDPPLNARYVAFYLIENNKTDWFSSEDIRPSEIRINGRSVADLPPEPQVPTCANGRIP